MPREVFVSPNVPEAPEVSKKREDDNVATRLKMAVMSFDNQEFAHTTRESFLKIVDFKKMESIFARVYKKCGLDAVNMNFIGPERVVLNKWISSYYPEDNNINLYAHHTLDDDWGEKVCGSKELAVIKVLIHEEVHAVSRAVVIAPCEAVDGNAVYTQSGFSRQSHSKSLKWESKEIPVFEGKPIAHEASYYINGIFHALNEGMVEMLARKLFLEYLRESDSTGKSTEIYTEAHKKYGYKDSYNHEVGLLEWMINRIADKTNTEKTIIFDAFVRALMQGEVFDDVEVKELFQEAFGEDFLRQLSDLSGGSDYEKIRGLINGVLDKDRQLLMAGRNG